MDIPATTIVNVAIPRAQPYRGVMGVRYPDFALSDGVIELRRWSLARLGLRRGGWFDLRIPAGTTVPARWSVDGGRESPARYRRPVP